jgi:hypothetical protein
MPFDFSRISALSDSERFEYEAQTAAVRVMETEAATSPSDTEPSLRRATSGRAYGAPSLAGALRSPVPLSAQERGFFEPRLAYDFSGVRIHTGAAADASARGLRARASRLGHHVVFARGKYAPETYEGQKLLAHELTHVIQQGNGLVRGSSLLASRSRANWLP